MLFIIKQFRHIFFDFSSSIFRSSKILKGDSVDVVFIFILFPMHLIISYVILYVNEDFEGQ